MDRGERASEGQGLNPGSDSLPYTISTPETVLMHEAAFTPALENREAHRRPCVGDGPGLRPASVPSVTLAVMRPSSPRFVHVASMSALTPCFV